MDNKRFVIAIFLTILVCMVVFLEFDRMQMKAMYKNANAIASNLENKLQNAVKDVEFLHLAGVYEMQKRKLLPLQSALFIKKIDNNGSYALDGCDDASIPLNDKINLLGYNNSVSYTKYLYEMQAALNLEPYMKLIYKKINITHGYITFLNIILLYYFLMSLQKILILNLLWNKKIFIYWVHQK